MGQVIRGWDDGVAQMSLGEKAMLRITSDYGYGAAGAGGVIPPNADLNFEGESPSIRLILGFGAIGKLRIAPALAA